VDEVKLPKLSSLKGRGRVRPKRDGSMNKLETRYSEHLEELRLAGGIVRWDFEPEKLRLADRTYYAPDFRVLLPDGSIEFHETKGFWEEDARVKFKVAAEMHPYTFRAIRWKNKQWEIETL